MVRKLVVQCTMEDREGAIALEAALSLPIFVFMMLALYSLTVLFTAQSVIGHALSQSSQSLSLETYSTDTLGRKWGTSALLVDDLKSLLSMTTFNTSFVSDDQWYKETYGDADDVVDMSRKRFCSYLAGSESASNELLQALGVEDGLSGMDFSESSLEGRDLTVTVKYKIKLLFGIRAFHMELFDFDAKQSVCSRLWGAPDL